MKKIGVITWFRYNNYGTKLQALALQVYLRKNGFEPELIDFELEDSIKAKKNGINLYSFFCRILRKMAKLINYKHINEKENNMPNIIKNNCNISNYINNKDEYISTCNKYDYLIFGSDQIWNPNWFHPYYYANFDSIKVKRIAYAPSIGVKLLPDNLLNNYKEALLRFDNIAMREKNSCKLIEKLTSKKVCEVLDPVFLLSRAEWSKYESDNKFADEKFILCYILTDNKNHWKAIKKYAKESGKKMVVIPVGGYSYFSCKDVIDNCSANDFLRLFDECDEVITDSFHGTVFSIIYNKKVTVFERHDPKSSYSENERIINILNIVGLSDILIPFNSKTIKKTCEFDYKNINKVIQKRIIESKNYIDSSLK